jgi:hypothetical protein
MGTQKRMWGLQALGWRATARLSRALPADTVSNPPPWLTAALRVLGREDTLLKRLAQGPEDMPAELGPFIQEEHAMVRQ